MTHHLKSYPEFFAATVIGVKTHEIRNNLDNLSVEGGNNPFRVGDRLVLEEFDPETGEFSGETCQVRVTWISGPKPWIDSNYVVMSITREVVAH